MGPDLRLLHPIVGRFARDGDVVHVALAQAGATNANESSLLLQFRYARAADVSHAALQTADELVDHHRDGAAIRHAALNSFRYKLREPVSGIAVFAEPCVLRALFFRTLEVAL